MKNLRSTRSLIASLAAAPIMMAAAWPAMAQTYPTHPVVIVVPFSPALAVPSERGPSPKPRLTATP